MSEEEFELLKNTKEYFDEYIGYNGFIEFRIVDLTKTIPNTNRHPLFSRFASNWDEVLQIIKTFGQDKRYIVYNSTNNRTIKGKKDSSCRYRTGFYLDVEGSPEKYPYSDAEYYNKLMDTIKYLVAELRKIKMDYYMIKESGRGLHLLVKIKPMVATNTDMPFKSWFKSFIERTEEKRPHDDIKFSDSVFNVSRIESTPNTIHFKYPELPFRKIIAYNPLKPEIDIYPIINRATHVQRVLNTTFSKMKKKYDNETIYQCPEFLLLKNNPSLPEGELHHKIIFMLKLLVRDNNIDAHEFGIRLSELGYNETIDTPPPENKYNPMVLFNYAMKNYEYFYDRKIHITFDTKKEVIIYINREMNNPTPDYVKNFEEHSLSSFKDVLNYIRFFNDKTAEMDSGKIIIWENTLKEKIRRNSPEKLYKYIEWLGLWKIMLGQFHKLESSL